VKKNWRNLQFLCLIYITGTEECGTVMPRKLKKKNGAIASVSLVPNEFTFKHRDSKETVSELIHTAFGDERQSQTHWQHRLPPLRITTPRVNLTFEQLKYYRLLFYFKNKHNSTTSY
jgi:hypothetical protein